MDVALGEEEIVLAAGIDVGDSFTIPHDLHLSVETRRFDLTVEGDVVFGIQATELLEAAISFARKSGARTIDGYPLLDDSHGSASLYVGTYSMFHNAGFVEISRVRDRPLMRLRLAGEG